jgi:putative FmdB family regulatory protein
MPLYEYECPKCDCHFDLKRSYSDDGNTEPCPKCSGFYVTDSRSHNSAQDESKPKGDNGKKLESKEPEAKAAETK